MFLPETSTPNILLRRAHRLRNVTGDKRLVAQSEIDQKCFRPSAILLDAIIKPMEITVKDPAIAFVNLYMALVYGIYYSFFEVFPLVYPVYYGFSLGMIGVVFTCVLIACLIGVTIYCLYLYFLLVPDVKAHGLRTQESRLVPALYACFGPTIGLFICGWIAPTIGITIYAASVFIVMQCIFVYIPISYPQYPASLLAANDFLRSALGPWLAGVSCSRGHSSSTLGVSLLGDLSVIGIFGMFGLWTFGAKMRARSKFAIA
ncbi:multidrug transporter [Penicillium cf. viridicatum]|uniref:Multidrug transporter n=1 Tax=Penicillium cf. viridicatum TaxID=2972119 RepID=A0A9W9JIV8_9EURO|nr:multidrug transporter [Penicillium cf. viridicatum]